MKEIILSRNMITIVDDEDFDYINQWKWYVEKAGTNYYACRHEPMINGNKNRKVIRMHSQLMNTPLGMCTDHINGDGLDNQRNNLRICTRGQNTRNRHIVIGEISYKGVFYRTYKGKRKTSKYICADIKINGKTIHLGTFENIHEAAIAYDDAAIKYCGEFAHLNFPDRHTKLEATQHYLKTHCGTVNDRVRDNFPNPLAS
jgi:hypothetical protein